MEDALATEHRLVLCGHLREQQLDELERADDKRGMILGGEDRRREAGDRYELWSTVSGRKYQQGEKDSYREDLLQLFAVQEADRLE